MSVPTETRDDAELLRASRSDLDAFATLYDRYAGRLLDYFTRRTSSEDTALELCAETLSRAWTARERFEDQHDGSAAPWLYGIARNVLLMSIRRGAVERATATRLGVLERLDLPGDPTAAPEPGWADGADELLESLPPSLRSAIRLRIVDELDYDEVADALGTTGVGRPRPRPPRPRRPAQAPLRIEGESPMTDFSTDRASRLDDLRGALLAAAAADLETADAQPATASQPRPAARPVRRLRFGTARARLALAFLVIAVAVPGIVIGSGLARPERASANGLPAGSKVMTATQPTCTAMREGVEYECAFADSPRAGRVLRIVDSSGKVDGGCLSRNVVETVWICYFGAAAVNHQVVAQGAL